MNGFKVKRNLLFSFIMITLSLVLSLTALFGIFHKENSKAYTSGQTPASIGSLTLSNYATRTDGIVFDGDVLQKLYDKITGTPNSTYQSVYNAVNNSTSRVQGAPVQNVTTDTTLDSNGISTQVRSMNFSQLSGGTLDSGGVVGATATAPNPIIVEFGGYTWDVVYMTTNTTAGNNDLVATLWMNDAIVGDSTWSAYRGSLATNVDYPACMYSTSILRVEALNGGGDNGVNYATSTSARNGTVLNREQNQFAQFTLSSAKIGNKSLTDYLVSPGQMAYQEKENFVWSYTGARNVGCKLAPNDAWGVPDENVTTPNGQFGGWNTTVRVPNDTYSDMSSFGGTSASYMQVNSNTGRSVYTEWADDYLWIPSLVEVGGRGSNYYDASLWGIPTCTNTPEILGSSNSYWIRSGSTVKANNGLYMNVSGGHAIDYYVENFQNEKYHIRPALHLNLTAASDRSAKAVEKFSISDTTYNRATQTLDLTTLTEFDAGKMEVTEIVRDTSLPATGNYTAPAVVAATAPATPTKVEFTESGKYKVKIKTKTTQDADGKAIHWIFKEPDPNGGGGTIPGTNTTTIEFKVKKAQLTVPNFGTGAAASKVYDGSTFTFKASNYPSANVTGYPRDPLSVSISNGNGVLSPQPNTTATSSSELEVEMRSAGNYKATFTISDTVNYEWTDGTQTSKDASFAITQKPLTVTSTTTVTGNVWGWSADSSESGTVTVSDFFNGDNTQSADSVNLKLEISDATGGKSYLTGTDNGNGSYTFTVDSSISIFGGTYTSGTYYLKPVLSNGSAGTHDGNYELTTALSGLNGGLGYKLVIGTASAGLPSYTWTYTEDGGSDQAMPSDNKLTYKFNANTTSGAVYEVTVDTSGFAAAFIAIDTSKYTNGYKNRSASVAGHYVTTLALKTTDSDHTFSLPGGGTSTTSEITLEWDIEKADYDFTNVKWQYTDTDGNTKNYPAQWNATNSVWEYLDEDGNVASGDPGIPWYGENYTLTLTGLPSGVTVNNPTGAYTGNKEKFISVNGYQAECTGITSDTSNYNAIPANLLKLDWKIVKGKVIIRASGSWTTSQQGSDSNIFYVPTLQNVSGVEYEYYDLGTTANSPGPGTLLGGLSDVTSVLGTKHYYYVKAVVASGVSSDGSTLWIDAIEIVDETNPAPKYGACTKAFETGDNRTPVQITLNGAPYTYDGQEHGVLNDGSNNGELEIKVGGNVFPTSRFTILYYEYDANNSADHFKGTPIPDPPTDAGKYIIEIQLTVTAAQDYYATDEYFEFEIKPYVLDMSQVKWGYIDKDGNEVEYNPASPLQYGLDENGDPVKHNIVLIGLPKGDANGDAAAQLLAKMYEESGLGNDGSDGTKPQIITYTGNKDETAVTGGSGGGQYTTTATLSGLSPNFKLGSLPTFFTEDPGTGEVSSTQDWKVEPKKLNAPKDDNTHSFTGEALDILTFAGLNPEELGLYYEITSITYYDKDFNTHNIYTNPHASGNAQRPTEAELQELKDALATVKNAGTYMLTARLIDSNNVKFLVNGVPGTAPSYLAQIDIQKLKLTVTGWTNPSAPKNNTPWEPTYDGNFPAGVVENKITDDKGKEVSEAEWTVGWNKIYYQTLRPTSGNEDNVEIEYAAGVDETVSFDRGDEEGVIYGEIEKPTYTNVSTGTLNGDGVLESTFNGEAQDFTPEGLSTLISQNRIKLYAVDGEGNEKEVSIEYFKQKNAGKYKVIARINGNFKWKDSKDKADVVFEFEVQKAQVKAEWDTTGERPVLSIPEGFEDYVEYEYRDEKGNVVAEKNLKKGVSYTVTAKVKEGETENIEFLFTDLDGNEVIGGSMESGFTVPGGNGLNDLFGLPEDFPLWQIIVICVCLILFIIFMIITGKKRKEKKEADEETKKYEEDMMLNS